MSVVGFVGAVAFGCTSLLGDFSSGPESGVDGSSSSASVGSGADATADAPDSRSQQDDAAIADASDGAAPSIEAGDAGPNDASPNDASADADASPPWSPTLLDNQNELALWLEASPANLVISSGLVGTWHDLSKNKNDAINSSGGPQQEMAVINGHDAVHFDARGVLLTINDAASLQLGTDQFCFAVVARASISGGYFFSKVTTAVSGAGPQYSSGLEFFVSADAVDDAGNTIVDDAGLPTVFPAAHVDSLAGNEIDWLGPAFEDNAYHVVILRRTSAQGLSLAIDSQPTQTMVTGEFNVSQAGEDVNIGGVAYGSRATPVDLSIAEMIVIHSSTGVVADTDVASVQGYLEMKYGL